MESEWEETGYRDGPSQAPTKEAEALGDDVIVTAALLVFLRLLLKSNAYPAEVKQAIARRIREYLLPYYDYHFYDYHK